MYVLFLCVANSARSQMAEGLARHLAPDHWTLSSAGSQPTKVRPEAIAALGELGIDISDQSSKGTDHFDVNEIDVVITLCAEEVCPTSLLGASRLHWPVKDPAIDGTQEARMTAFRRARDEIREKIETFLAEREALSPRPFP